MTTDSLGWYLREIGKIPLLEPDTERRLAREIVEGRLARARINAGNGRPDDERVARRAARSRDTFEQANLRLVVSVARRYPRVPGMELMDLIQEGNLGLRHAVEKYDPDRGFRFSTYATHWIRQAIARAVDRQSPAARMPIERARQVRQLLRDGSTAPIDPELTRAASAYQALSLDAAVGDEDGVALGDLIADDVEELGEAVAAAVDLNRMGTWVRAADEPSIRAAAHRFGLISGTPQPLAQVAREMSTRPSTIAKQVKLGLSRLQELLHDERTPT